MRRFVRTVIPVLAANNLPYASRENRSFRVQSPNSSKIALIISKSWFFSVGLSSLFAGYCGTPIIKAFNHGCACMTVDKPGKSGFA